MDYVLLGLLSHEPMTGYEIKKRLDTSLRFFWGGSFGSIYPTLNQLEKERKVTRENTSSNGREKISYSITEIGRTDLKEWLEKPTEKIAEKMKADMIRIEPVKAYPNQGTKKFYML